MVSRPGRQSRKIPMVTLLTDFGLRDEYAGVVKGVILARAPGTVLVDISHQVPPQDVAGAALILAGAYPWFPAGTLHLAVVDPTVGTDRRIVLVAAHHHLFLAPDNGLLTLVLDETHEGAPPVQAWAVTNRELWPAQVHPTFHGRDVFAPVAGALAGGRPPAAVGPAVAPATLCRLAMPKAERRAGAIHGQVIHVDRFGNLTTNVTTALLGGWLAAPERLVITVAGRRIHGLVTTYGGGRPGDLLALVGSRNRLEIAVRDGNAARSLAAGTATPLTITRCT